MSLFEDDERFLTAQEAARLLGVSERSIYGYVARGTLTNVGIGHNVRLLRDEVRAFLRTPAGRTRQRVPCWRQAPEGNALTITQCRVRLRPGAGPQLRERLDAFRMERKHLLSGTTARYIWFTSQEADQIQILLFWREAIAADPEARDQEMQAFQQDLADVLDWSTMEEVKGLVLLHAG